MTRRKLTKNERRLAVDNTRFDFNKMTVGDALALNEAARQTCAFEMTSQIGDQA